ncbi:Metallo-dependent phosphatase-like protein [Endogone sp. FLAS-F59071]|nr:Metallo-dependent phosphatase-like protein [Endogone sp. FLAS-F59071]|eukprot:RUS18758.1 Metallo-dependent phosphatase-like protein [Endogone sp. FLAS-F59071]
MFPVTFSLRFPPKTIFKLCLFTCSLVALLTFFFSSPLSALLALSTPGDLPTSAYDHVPLSPYANLTQLATLPALITASSTHRRLIVVGDVHGCLDELNALLVKVQFDPTSDHLIFAGDLLAKGPKSIEVLRRVKELGASCVRGNHDDKVIRWKGYQLQLQMEHRDKEAEEYVDPKEMPEEFRESNMSEHRLLARALTFSDYAFLLSCPLILEIPEFNSLVVHAGLDPSIPSREIKTQDPQKVMYMRNIYKDVPRAGTKRGKHWAKIWNDVQRLHRFPLTVWYGHDAKRGLRIMPFSVGTDTGCVYGRMLTAVTMPEREVISVPCKKYAS